MALKSQTTKEILSRLSKKSAFEVEIRQATGAGAESEAYSESPPFVTSLTASCEAGDYFRVAERRALGAIWRPAF